MAQEEEEPYNSTSSVVSFVLDKLDWFLGLLYVYWMRENNCLDQIEIYELFMKYKLETICKQVGGVFIIWNVFL